MYPRLTWLFVAAMMTGLALPAAAGPGNPAEKRRERDFWWNSYMPTPARRDRTEDQQYRPTYSDALASRLGVVDGKARIFRYELDSSHNAGRTIEGALDGNGVKVRFKW